MARTGWMITLEGRLETLYDRIQRHVQSAAPDAIRPMIGGDDQLEKMRALKQSRQPIYALADWTVHTDRLSPEQVAHEVVRAIGVLEATEPSRP